VANARENAPAVSIRALARGRTRYARVGSIKGFGFNPRPRTRANPDVFPQDSEDKCFNPRPRTRANFVATHAPDGHGRFQSAPSHEGERRPWPVRPSDHSFQSAPSHEGEHGLRSEP